jgi:hypothetical protein
VKKFEADHDDYSAITSARLTRMATAAARSGPT